MDLRSTFRLSSEDLDIMADIAKLTEPRRTHSLPKPLRPDEMRECARMISTLERDGNLSFPWVKIFLFLDVSLILLLLLMMEQPCCTRILHYVNKVVFPFSS